MTIVGCSAPHVTGYDSPTSLPRITTRNAWRGPVSVSIVPGSAATVVSQSLLIALPSGYTPGGVVGEGHGRASPGPASATPASGQPTGACTVTTFSYVA